MRPTSLSIIFIFAAPEYFPAKVEYQHADEDNAAADYSRAVGDLTRKQKAEKTCQKRRYEHIVTDLRGLLGFGEGFGGIAMGVGH